MHTNPPTRMTWEEQASQLISQCHSSLEVEEMEQSRNAMLEFIRTQKSLSVQETLDAVRAGLPATVYPTGHDEEQDGRNAVIEEVRALLLSLTPSKEHGN